MYIVVVFFSFFSFFLRTESYYWIRIGVEAEIGCKVFKTTFASGHKVLLSFFILAQLDDGKKPQLIVKEFWSRVVIFL